MVKGTTNMLFALPEDLSSVPGTQIRWLQGDLTNLTSDLCGHSHSCRHPASQPLHTHNYDNKIKITKEKDSYVTFKLSQPGLIPGRDVIRTGGQAVTHKPLARRKKLLGKLKQKSIRFASLGTKG